MAENGASRIEEAKEKAKSGGERDAGLEKIKRQLAPPAGSVPMQGYLLKRSETLRRWNQRWFTLDPTTAKMEYRVQRSDPFPRGLLVLEATSTITVSPLNFHGAKQYEGCCLYIGGGGSGPAAKKREYFLCAETPGAARAWVATLRAAAVVLKAHRAAVDSIGVANGAGKARAGAVAAAAAAASATAREAAKEVAAANQMTVLGTHHVPVGPAGEAPLDNVTIMKETLRVKDEELHEMAADLRAREATLNELANRLSETAQAAESAAAAAHSMDRERKAAKLEVGRLQTELHTHAEKSRSEAKAAQESEAEAVAIRNKALAEVERLRLELVKATDRIAELQVAAYKADGRARMAEERERQAEAARVEALQEAARWRAEALRFGGAGVAAGCEPEGISLRTGGPDSLAPLAQAVPTTTTAAPPVNVLSSNGDPLHPVAQPEVGPSATTAAPPVSGLPEPSHPVAQPEVGPTAATASTAVTTVPSLDVAPSDQSMPTTETSLAPAGQGSADSLPVNLGQLEVGQETEVSGPPSTLLSDLPVFSAPQAQTSQIPPSTVPSDTTQHLATNPDLVPSTSETEIGTSLSGPPLEAAGNFPEGHADTSGAAGILELSQLPIQPPAAVDPFLALDPLSMNAPPVLDLLSGLSMNTPESLQAEAKASESGTRGPQ